MAGGAECHSKGLGAGGGLEGAETPESPQAGLSACLTEELTAQRTAALQAELAANSGLALAAVTHALALAVFSPYARDKSCLGITLTRPHLTGSASGIGQSRAIAARADQQDQWAERLPDAPHLWDWLIRQNRETLLDLLAFCAAQGVAAIRKPGIPKNSLRHADQLADATGLDMANWWQVSGPGYLAQLSKAQIIAALKEADTMPARARCWKAGKRPSWSRQPKPGCRQGLASGLLRRREPPAGEAQQPDRHRPRRMAGAGSNRGKAPR